jgi:hypothetical protein
MTADRRSWMLRAAPLRVGSALSLLDQGLTSLCNFSAVILAARALSASGFGHYSLIHLVYLVALGAFQALYNQTLVLETGDAIARQLAVVRALRSTLRAALVFSGLLAGAAVLASDDMAPLFAVLALTAPALLLRETLRGWCSLERLPQLAVVGNSLWLLGYLAAVMLIAANQTPSPWIYFATWSATGAASGFVYLAYFVKVGPISCSLEAKASLGKLGRRFMLEFVLMRGTSQSLVMALGALSTASTTGAVRGANSLFGPLNVLLNAVSAYAIPIVRSVAVHRHRRLAVCMSAALGGISGAVTTVLLLLPADIGHALLGETWPLARAYILPLGVESICLAVASVSMTFVRMTRPLQTLRVRMGVSAVVLAGFALGYWSGGPPLAIWGLVLGSTVYMVWTWRIMWISCFARPAEEGPLSTE